MTEANRKRVIEYEMKVRIERQQQIDNIIANLKNKKDRLNSFEMEGKINPYDIKLRNKISFFRREVEELEKSLDFHMRFLDEDILLDTSLTFSTDHFFHNGGCNHDAWIYFGQHPLNTQLRDFYIFYCLECGEVKACVETNVEYFRKTHRVINYYVSYEDWEKLNANPKENVLQTMRNKYFSLLLEHDSFETFDILKKECDKKNENFPLLKMPTKISSECEHPVWMLMNRSKRIDILMFPLPDNFTDNDDLANMYIYKCLCCDLPAKTILKNDNQRFIDEHMTLDLGVYGWGNFYKVRSRFIELLEDFSIEKAMEILRDEYLNNGKKLLKKETI